MSADNGYLLRKNKDNKYVLQHYFLSADEYPPIDADGAEVFDDALSALKRYSEIDSMDHPTEYGLTVRL